VVKGFAIGRTVFGAAARDWLSGAIDDDTAVDRMATSFDRLTRAWRELRADGQ
jgi:5-dehydro-2-deoxygluconokinase